MADDARDSQPVGADGTAPAAATTAKPTLRERSERWTARVQATVDRLEGQRPAHASVEVGFRWIVRDKQIAGGVLGGGLAYRLFFWALAIALLICGGLGFAGRAGDDVGGAAHDAGLTQAVADSVASAAHQSESGRWWLLVIGAWSFLWFSWSLVRAVRLVHAAAWQAPILKLPNLPRAFAVMIAVPVMVLALSAAAGWLRANVGAFPGLLATLVVAIGYGAIWLFVSKFLPSGEGLPWHAYLPGAAVFGFGIEALHLFTVYYLATKLANASTLYGSLGLAGTTLFYLYLIGRGLVWAAELNAVVWTVRTERDPGLARAELAAPAELGSDPDPAGPGV
jgi:membrane protein